MSWWKDLLEKCPLHRSHSSFCPSYSTSKKALAQSICCNAATAVTQPAVTTVIPAYTGPVGSEPSCPICRTNEYPGIPYAFIVARYVGEFTCDQLYGRGLHGMIPSYMCGPLQDFAQSICGCGIYNPGSSTVTYSLTARTSLTAAPRTAPRAETYSSQPGARKLRGGANDEVPEPVAIPSPEDLHFETKELPADFFSTETETQA